MQTYEPRRTDDPRQQVGVYVDANERLLDIKTGAVGRDDRGGRRGGTGSRVRACVAQQRRRRLTRVGDAGRGGGADRGAGGGGGGAGRGGYGGGDRGTAYDGAGDGAGERPERTGAYGSGERGGRGGYSGGGGRGGGGADRGWFDRREMQRRERETRAGGQDRYRISGVASRPAYAT
jgi:hypothetical protein